MRGPSSSLLLCLVAACASADDIADDAVQDEVAELSAAARRFYGVTTQGQSLVYYEIKPPSPNGKKAFLTFALHGFEDAWAQDGRALYSIAHRLIEYYGAHPGKLAGWTLYVVPSANPDGMRYGVNNQREGQGAYGRCTSTGKDINRHTSDGTSIEQRKLKQLFDAIGPTIAIDFHGWYDTYYGDTRIGGFFQRAFNASYEGKPGRYCFVASTGAMDCGPTLGGIFHGSPSITADLFAEWARSARGVPAALIEYPAPDFNETGVFDTVWDEELGYRRMATNTLDLLWGRTRVALNDLLASY